MQATADQVAKKVSSTTWGTLARKWRKRRCRWLAELAKEILEAKKTYHEIPAWIARKLAEPTLRHEAERQFVQELVAAIPLPHDRVFVEAARYIRVVGISMCTARGYPLEYCACFVDLTEEQTQAEIKQLLVSHSAWLSGQQG